MKWLDISIGLSQQLPVWEGDPPVHIERFASMDAGDGVNVTRIALSAHSGTHVDAPRHFIDGGQTVDEMLLDHLIGAADVLQIPDEVDLITSQVVEQFPPPKGARRILFKTRNSSQRLLDKPDFVHNFVAIHEDAAQLLVRWGIWLVGVDYLSVAPFANPNPTHQVLLTAGVIVVEGLDLFAVTPGEYVLICLPLKLMGTDGAPARAVLGKLENRAMA